MTGKTHRSRRGDEETTRMHALMRADAAAVIDDDLDDETLDEDVRLADESADDPTQASQRTRSQVYSIRVPVERLEQVRCLAKERGVAPTVMLREWVLTQLDAQTGAEPALPESALPAATKPRTAQKNPDEQRQDTAAKRLDAATAALVDVAGQLTKTLAMLTELLAAQSSTVARPVAGIRALPPHQDFPAAASLHAFVSSGMPERLWATAGFGRWLASADAGMHLTIRHVYRGLAELRSTVENASSWPGFGDYDLGALYMAADEELSNP
jgi:hypothetical protein